MRKLLSVVWLVVCAVIVGSMVVNEKIPTTLTFGVGATLFMMFMLIYVKIEEDKKK